MKYLILLLLLTGCSKKDKLSCLDFGKEKICKLTKYNTFSKDDHNCYSINKKTKLRSEYSCDMYDLGSAFRDGLKLLDGLSI